MVTRPASGKAGIRIIPSILWPFCSIDFAIDAASSGKWQRNVESERETNEIGILSC